MSQKPEPFHQPSVPSRRRFFGVAAGGLAAAAGGTALVRNGEPGVPTPAAPGTGSTAAVMTEITPPRPLPASADVAGRTLVVIELQGGNDGLATLVPRNAGTLYDRREVVHVPDEELVDFTDEFGWHPNLAPILSHNVAALVGLGTTNNPDGSHFEMERRWWAGKSTGNDLPGTGFLGRLCDQLVTDQPITGVSLGSGPTPALRSDKAITVGMSDPQASWFLRSEEPWFENFRSGMLAMSAERVANATPHQAAMSGLADTLEFARSLGEIDQERIDERYPGGSLGDSLGLAAELINQQSGIRVIHVAHGGFDTHSGQRGDHDYLIEQLGEATGAFLDDISDRGFSDSTLVCTTSEFGRRVSANGSGTDHGAAGMAILSGPVENGVHGEPPSLTRLDDDNLIATADFEQYYATISERWFGIPSSEVLESAPTPIDGIIA